MGDWRISNCHESKTGGDRQSCPVCFGVGQWLGYSDAEWRQSGGTKPPTTPMRCALCAGQGHVRNHAGALIDTEMEKERP